MILHRLPYYLFLGLRAIAAIILAMLSGERFHYIYDVILTPFSFFAAISLHKVGQAGQRRRVIVVSRRPLPSAKISPCQYRPFSRDDGFITKLTLRFLLYAHTDVCPIPDGHAARHAVADIRLSAPSLTAISRFYSLAASLISGHLIFRSLSLTISLSRLHKAFICY